MQCTRILLLYFFLTSLKSVTAQVPAIGNWRDHLPYHQATQVINTPSRVWSATPFSVFFIDKDDNSIGRLSKVNGLHETGVQCIAWEASSDILIIGYTNSRVDIVEENQVSVIDGIRDAPYAGDKNIYHIFTAGELVYVSTGFGIVVIDIVKKEVRDTYIIGTNGDRVKVNALASDGAFLYAATAEGLKEAPVTGANLSDYRNWQLLSGTNGLPTGEVSRLASNPAGILAAVNDSLFSYSAGHASLLYSSVAHIRHVDVSGNNILLSTSSPSTVTILDLAGTVQSTLQNGNFIVAPAQATMADNAIWIADSARGLSKFDGGNFVSYAPSSPLAVADGDMNVYRGELWVAAGSVSSNWEPLLNKNGVFGFADGSWTNLNSSNTPAFDSLPDVVTVAVDPKDGSLWAGSFGGGLVNRLRTTEIMVYKQNSAIQPDIFSPLSYRVSGLAFDQQQNLWIANYGAPQSLVVHTADGAWQSFSIPFPLAENGISSIVVDDLGQVWLVATKGQGLVCYSPGASITNTSDDQWKWYRSGQNNGNLPDDNVLSIARDKNNFIWVGTAQGIGIIECPQLVFTSAGCNATLPVVQQDSFAGYLFRDEVVQAIAVDGADRKWIGTKNGVWLVSADGDKTIYRFTSDNSPLLANDVHHIDVDGNSGEVFFETSNGICSFRSTATEAGVPENTVLIFPNPVPPGYTGTIAIRGVANNAIVKITELNGRMVYQTRALGGQAVWNGKNYKNQQIASGVYLVLVANDSGAEKLATKIVVIKK